MMIFIPFDKHKSIGGPATFLRNLKVYLDGVGYPYREHYKKGDSIFFPISYDLRMLRKVKKYHGRIIQRLDGVYYPSYHGGGYKSRNEKLGAIYHDYADWIVFQSDYCRLQCLDMLGERKSPTYKIIHNGVDQAIFFPCQGPLSGNDSIEFITTGNFRSSFMLESILNALDLLKNKFSFRLHICGPVKDKLASLYAERPYVVAHGKQDLHGVADLLRKSHIFLFSNINPPCPNSVLEAVACGLPVVSFNSGSLAELMPFSENLLAHVSSDLIQSAGDFHFELLAEKILFAVENLPQLQVNAREHAKDFSFSTCGAAYVEMFSSISKI